MQVGMIGLGRMGSNMVRRLLKAGHECIVYNRSPAPVQALVGEGASGAASLAEFVRMLHKPRAIWLMVPAAAVEAVLAELATMIDAGDVLIDGGNSYYHDDIRRASWLKAKGIHYLDVGTSGGVWGVERGYCLMIGGEPEMVLRLDSIFKALSPGIGAASHTPNRKSINSTAEAGYLHCGPNGAGHFVKMVHNGIEYGLMEAYAEGFNIIKNANIGRHQQRTDAETTPLRHAEHYQYEVNISEVAEVWRRGSVIGSWLLDLIASALARDPELSSFDGQVSDSGEGRWTLQAAVDEGIPAPVISAALFARFSSRGQSDFADKLLSAMRYEFGGHLEKKA
jgi:6-phosphogluconate dehydrogenase